MRVWDFSGVRQRKGRSGLEVEGVFTALKFGSNPNNPKLLKDKTKSFNGQAINVYTIETTRNDLAMEPLETV